VSVSLSVDHVRSPAKKAERSRCRLGADLVDPMKYALNGGQDKLPHGTGQFWGLSDPLQSTEIAILEFEATGSMKSQ